MTIRTVVFLLSIALLTGVSGCKDGKEKTEEKAEETNKDNDKTKDDDKAGEDKADAQPTADVATPDTAAAADAKGRDADPGDATAATDVATDVPADTGTTTEFAMFVQGSTAAYTFDVSREYWDDQHENADDFGNVVDESTIETTCTVESVTDVGDLKMSYIICAEPPQTMSVELITGYYLRDETSIWYAYDTSDVAAIQDLKKSMPIYTFPPAADKVSDMVQDDGGCEWERMQSGDSWCHTEACVGGDEAGRTICIDAAGNITSASGYFGGGSVEEVTATRVP